MKPTVIQGLTGRAVPQGQELDVLNNEMRPVLDAVREAANFESVFKTVVTSADSPGVAKRLWESAQTPSNGVWLCEMRWAALAPSGNSGVRIQFQPFQITAGVIAPLGFGFADFSQLNVLTTPTFNIDATANTIYVEATDDGSGQVTWVTVVRVLEVAL